MRILRTIDDGGAQPEPFNFRSSIAVALDPELSVTRYNRTWRLSRPDEIGTTGIWGKLGFLRSRGDSAVEYDESRHDFITIPGTAGHGSFAYYVVDLENQYLLFEERSPDIKRNSFAGALRSLFVQTADPGGLSAEFVPDVESFDDWMSRTEKLTRFFTSLRQPNPNWTGRPRAIRDLMEETRASRISIEARAARDGESLRVQGTDLERFADYAGEGYGVIRGTGETPDGRTFFDSERNIRSTDVDISPDDREITVVQRIWDALQNLVP